jgi:hypothetical protein
LKFRSTKKMQEVTIDDFLHMLYYEEPKFYVLREKICFFEHTSLCANFLSHNCSFTIMKSDKIRFWKCNLNYYIFLLSPRFAKFYNLPKITNSRVRDVFLGCVSEDTSYKIFKNNCNHFVRKIIRRLWRFEEDVLTIRRGIFTKSLWSFLKGNLSYPR